MIIVATPIHAIPGILKAINGMDLRFTFVCEIGSVKGKLVKEYEDIMTNKSGIWFESVHPMIGPLATDWSTFNWSPKTCLIIQQDVSQIPETNWIANFWKDLGFKTHRVDPFYHDRVIGTLSHLSHFMILTYVDYVEKTLKPHEIALAGPSFEKFKTLAQGARRLEDIYINNEELPKLIAEYSDHMDSIISRIQGLEHKGEFY